MRSKLACTKIIWMLLLIELVAAGTVLHRRIEIDPNGDKRTKTWTTQDADEDFPRPSQSAANEGFQTFTRNGITLRIKPQTTTLRIGGNNISPDQLLEQAKYAKDLELTAVRQLLNTGHPVKRTNIENGLKHTSTYTLEPDGSILYRKVEDIDEANVDRRFEEILKQSVPQNPNKLGGDWEWADDDESKDDEEELTTIQSPKEQTPPASKPEKPSTNPSATPKPTKPQQTAKTPNVPTWQAPSNDFFGVPTKFDQYPKLPKTWDTDTWSKEDPFNPPELPPLGGFNNEDFDTEPIDENAPPNTQTFTSTKTDKDGNTVQTVYTSGPNEWRRKTVKISSNYQPTETTEESTTIQTRIIPSLDDFLKTQYSPGNDAKPLSSTPPNWSISTTPKTIKTINIADLPAVAVVNLNKPIEEQFLQPLGSNAADLTPIKTLKVENISPSPDVPEPHVERTKIRTITKTLPSNQAPTAANLDPNMLDILQRAGIKPEEIASTNGQSITRTRIEPDGRVVKTTYRVSPTYPANSYNFPTQAKFDYSPFGARPFGVSPFEERPFGARSPYDRPLILSEPFPNKHRSTSHFGVDFTPFAAVPPMDDNKPEFNPKSIVRDREPLEPQYEDEDVDKSTLNPLLIHPLNEPVPAPKNDAPLSEPVKPKNGKSAIAEFLAQLGLSVDDLMAQKGEFVKTIVDDDGRVLTARFVLSAPVGSKSDK